MKIVEIIPRLGFGGAERFVVDLVNYMSVSNEVILITLYPLNRQSDKFLKSEIKDNIRIISLNKKPGFDFKISLKLNAILKSLSPTVVHTHLGAFEYVLYSIISLRDIRFFHTVHNDAKKEGRNTFFSFLRKMCYKFHLVYPITISKESHSSFVNFYKLNAKRIDNGRSIPEGISVSDSVMSEMSLFRGNSETRIICYIARFAKQKRQDIVAKICNDVYNRGYNFKMLFIGAVRDKEIYERTMKQQSSCVKILGEKNNPLEYLIASDAFCLFSSYEGLPISLIESLGVQCLPICTPVGGIKDLIIDGYNGLLSGSINEEDCKKTLIRFLMMSHVELNKMKQNLWSSYLPYSMLKCSQAYIDYFKEVLYDGKSGNY